VALPGIITAPVAPAENRLDGFQQLMPAHLRMVLGTTLHMLGRLEDAQDISPEVFLRLYRRLDRIDAALARPRAGGPGPASRPGSETGAAASRIPPHRNPLRQTRHRKVVVGKAKADNARSAFILVLTAKALD
jgi:hypothetical protein